VEVEVAVLAQELALPMERVAMEFCIFSTKENNERFNLQ
jgi:hypothetical protein